MNVKRFNVSVPIKDNNTKIVGGLVQYDTANVINVKLIDGTEPFDYTGYTDIMVQILKPDGHSVVAGITDGPNDNNPYTIQAVAPAEGRLMFSLQGQATILTGTYFCTISLFNAGKVLTTARINYYVGESLTNEFDPGIQSDDDYNFLLNLINRNSAIASAEATREDAEALRAQAEEERKVIFQTLVDNINAYLVNAQDYVNKTQAYMKDAERFAELAQNPNKEALQAVITELNLAAKEYVDTKVNDNTKDFIVGDITTPTEQRKKLFVGTSTKQSNGITALSVGEMCVGADGIPLMGTNGGNVAMTSVHIGPTAPAFDNLLWVDTSEGGQLKYYDGTWKPVSLVAFS